MEPAKLAPYLAGIADDVAHSTDHATPVAMARGRRGFALAGLVSVLLDEETGVEWEPRSECSLVSHQLTPLTGCWSTLWMPVE